MPVIQGGYTNRLNYWDTTKDGPKPEINSNFFPLVRNGVSMMSRPNTYDPRNLPTLIGNYDFSDITLMDSSFNSFVLGGGISYDIFLTLMRDKTKSHNDLQGVGSNCLTFIDTTQGIIQGFSVENVYSNALAPGNNTYITNSYLQNNGLSMRYRTDGITVFIVAKLGYTVNGTDIISIFGSSNSSQVSRSNVLFIRTDSDNNIYATNGINNAGASNFIVYNNNERKLITGVFTTSNSTLTINGTIIGPTSCGTVFSTDYNTFNLSIGTPETKYTLNLLDLENGNLNNINTLNEILVYNTVLTNTQIKSIEDFLANKWSINRTQTSFPNIRKISNLITWLDLKTRSNLELNVNDISIIRSSDGLSNTYTATITVDFPQYNSINNTVNFLTNDTPPFLGNLFTGTGTITGLTVSMVVRNLPLNNTSTLPNGNILSMFVPDLNLKNCNYPAITNDMSGNIFLTSNAYYTTNPNNYSFNLGSINGNASDYYILTATYSNWNTQLYINGYAMAPQQISSSLPTWNLVDPIQFYNSFRQFSLLGGISYPNPVIPGEDINQSCTTEIGETLIYKKVLNTSELNTVHTYMLSNNNISNAISSNGLIAWFDAADFTSNTIVRNWNSKVGSLRLSNISVNGGIPFARQFVNPITGCNFSLVDLNNGLPSIIADLSNNIDLSGNNLNIFGVFTTNQSQTSNTYINISNSGTVNNGVQLDNSNNIFVSQYASSTYINNTIINIVNLSQNSIDSIPRLYNIPRTGTNSQGISQNLSQSNRIIIGDNNTPSRNSIGEILIYNRPLSNNEYTNILAYLQSKWTAPLFSRQDPVTIPDLALWYDPNTIGNGSTTWVSQYNGSFGPELAAGFSANIDINTSNKYLIVDGSTKQGFYSSTSVNISNSYTMFQVVRNFGISGVLTCFNNTVTNNILSPGILLSNGAFNIINVSNNTPYNVGDYSLWTDSTYNLSNAISIICSSYSNGKYNTRVKGTIQETTGIETRTYDANNGVPYILNIGALNVNPPNNRSTANIGEFIFYNRALNDLEKLSVFSYLESKWINGVGPLIVTVPTTNDFYLTSVRSTSNPYVIVNITNTWGGKSPISYSYDVVSDVIDSSNNIVYNITTINRAPLPSTNLSLSRWSEYTINVSITNNLGSSDSNTITSYILGPPTLDDFTLSNITPPQPEAIVTIQVQGQINFTSNAVLTQNVYYNYRIYNIDTDETYSQNTNLPITLTNTSIPLNPVSIPIDTQYAILTTLYNTYGSCTSNTFNPPYTGIPRSIDFTINNATIVSDVNATIGINTPGIEPIISYDWSIYNTDNNSIIYGSGTEPWDTYTTIGTITDPAVNVPLGSNYTISVSLTNSAGTGPTNIITGITVPLTLESPSEWTLDDVSTQDGNVIAKITINNFRGYTQATVHYIIRNESDTIILSSSTIITTEISNIFDFEADPAYIGTYSIEVYVETAGNNSSSVTTYGNNNLGP